MRLGAERSTGLAEASSARKTCRKPKPHKGFHRGHFRGGNAPASLKPLAGDRYNHEVIQFPGRQRPGLIEAPVGVGFSLFLLLISGEATPRPH